jgi:hypothetical protein
MNPPLSKREWFAGQFAASVGPGPPKECAEFAVWCADALIAELARTEPPSCEHNWIQLSCGMPMGEDEYRCNKCGASR